MANSEKAPVPEINEGLEVYNTPESPRVEYVRGNERLRKFRGRERRLNIDHEF